MTNRTVPRLGAFAALLVAIEGDLATACTKVLKNAGLSVDHAAGPTAAMPKIAEIQPYVVVVPASLKTGAQTPFEDCAIAVGAEIVWLDDVDLLELTDILMKAIERAVVRAAVIDED